MIITLCIVGAVLFLAVLAALFDLDPGAPRDDAQEVDRG